MPKIVRLASGMIRGATSEKVDYSLPLDGPLFRRIAVHLTNGTKLHGGKRNWMQACGPEDLARFREGAVRHFIQWYDGEADEDHAAACFCNLNGAEYVRERLAAATAKRPAKRR